MKILLAVDGSKYSEWATDYLVKLPLSQDPEVTVLSVVQDRPPVTHPVIPHPVARRYQSDIELAERRAQEKARELTTQVADRLRGRWDAVRPLVERGHPAEKIIETAQRGGAELIVLGSQGLSQVDAFLLGSVSQKVATYAPCSVLIVKRRVRAFRRVLVAVDGSQYSAHAVDFLKSQFRPDDLEVLVLYVWDHTVIPPSALKREKDQTLEGKYGQALKEAGFRSRALLARGHPAEAIVQTADQREVHLVVVGSRGLTGIKQFLLGSVSQKVMRYSERSVLIVRGH